MHDSVITANPVRLRHLGLLRFSGADSLQFLQGQVSNDTRRLGPCTSLLCALSNPQGRVVALLTLLTHTSGILAIAPRELIAPVAARLSRFILRSKVRIEDVSSAFFIAGASGSAALAAASLPRPGAPGACLESQGIAIARLPGADERFWIVGPDTSPGWLATATAASENDWRLADICAGVPQVYGVNSEQFVAQMLNLDLLDGISFTKGCYTGQEIIARTQNLGRIKRRMARVAAQSGDAALGARVSLADGRSGRICELARVGDGFEALAVLPLEPGGEEEASRAIPVQLQELPYSVSAGAKNTSTESSSTML